MNELTNEEYIDLNPKEYLDAYRIADEFTDNLYERANNLEIDLIELRRRTELFTSNYLRFTNPSRGLKLLENKLSDGVQELSQLIFYVISFYNRDIRYGNLRENIKNLRNVSILNSNLYSSEKNLTFYAFSKFFEELYNLCFALSNLYMSLDIEISGKNYSSFGG